MGSAFCGAQTRLSFRQRLFPRLVDFDKTQTALQDSTHTPTEQAMLTNRVLHCLEEELSESKRYNASSFLYLVIGYKMKCQMQNDPNCHFICRGTLLPAPAVIFQTLYYSMCVCVVLGSQSSSGFGKMVILRNICPHRFLFHPPLCLCKQQWGFHLQPRLELPLSHRYNFTMVLGQVRIISPVMKSKKNP